MNFDDTGMEELFLCAQINFDNVAKMNPGLDQHPIWALAKAQLDAAVKKLQAEEE
jgi:hypothetical protein